MKEEYWDRLIQGHLDDLLSDQEQNEFETLLRGSEAARQRFWELAEVHCLARDAARIAWPENDEELTEPKPAATVERRTAAAAVQARLEWLRPASLLAAGLLLGVVMSGLAWAISRPAWSSDQLLRESFESAVVLTAEGVPATTDRWSGDFAEIVAAQSGVQPISEGKMLRFLRADYVGKQNPGGYIGEVYRLLDVRNCRQELADGDAVVQVSAQFNVAEFPADEQHHCSIALFALDAASATDSDARNPLALPDRALATTRRSNQLLDHDPTTWQKLSTDLRIPPETEFLMLRIAVAHGAPNRRAPEHEKFAAHFADDVRVTLIRRPLLP